MTDQKDIKKEVKSILNQLYVDYEDQGILAIYLWGSITRQDFDPLISDIDSLAIIDKRMDPEERKQIKQWLASKFSRDLKFGLQFIGVEELNGAEPYTMLATYQTPAYLLLRFEEWEYVAGKDFSRDEFSVANMSPHDAMRHQLRQVKETLEMIEGTRQPDPKRMDEVSLCEDVVKGMFGALYWKTIADGAVWQINYDELVDKVTDEYVPLVVSLQTIRKDNNWSFGSIKSIQSQIDEAIKMLEA